MKKAPQLKSLLLWESFWDLDTMRDSSMGIRSIGLDKIHWYAKAELDLDFDERTAFVWIMRRVDTHYVEKQAAKMNKSNK